MSGSASHSTFDDHHLGGATLLKSSQTSAYLITLNADHTLTERSPFGSDSWGGTWEVTEAGDLIIQVGPYTSLYVPRKLASGGYLGAEGDSQMMIWFLGEHHGSVLDSFKGGFRKGRHVLDLLDEKAGLKAKGGSKEHAKSGH